LSGGPSTSTARSGLTHVQHRKAHGSIRRRGSDPVAVDFKPLTWSIEWVAPLIKAREIRI
jgi:hypothetical protein